MNGFNVSHKSRNCALISIVTLLIGMSGGVMANPLGPKGALSVFPVNIPHLNYLLETRCSQEPNGCLVWRGYCVKGYPQGGMFGKMRLLHRAVYIAAYGSIPEGMQLDHICDNTKCLALAHLKPVTPQDNTLRSANPCANHARQDKCVHGHEFDRIRIDSKGRKSRVCSTCSRERMAKHKCKGELCKS